MYIQYILLSLHCKQKQIDMTTYEAAIKLNGNTKVDIITINANNQKEASIYANRYGDVQYISEQGSGQLFL